MLGEWYAENVWLQPAENEFSMSARKLSSAVISPVFLENLAVHARL
jgi:hypothetical protein